MSEIKKPTVQLNEHIGNIIFDKKEIQPEDKPLTLKEKMVSMSNTEFGIKVQSVALPNNYNPILKSETQVVDWLRNKLHSQHS